MSVSNCRGALGERPGSSLPAARCRGALGSPCCRLTSICRAAELWCQRKERHHPGLTHPIPIFILLLQTCFSPRGSQQQPRATRSEQTGRLRSQKCTSVAVVAAHQPLRRTRETEQHRNQTTVTKSVSVNGRGPCCNSTSEILLPSWSKHFWLL